jgi:hypothetical protein
MTHETPHDPHAVTSRITELRQRARDNTITLEEMREAIALMRGDRVRAAATSLKSRTKKADKAQAAKAIDSDALLQSFMSL